MNEKIKNPLITILIILGILVLIGLLDTPDQTEREANKEVQQNLDNLSEDIKTSEQKNSVNTKDFANTVTDIMEEGEFKQNYMDGCVVVPNVKDYCQCTYDYLIDNYSKQEIMEMSINYTTGDQKELPPEMIKATTHCVDELPGQ